ncbi:MAG: GFA family protein [Halopseudomonas sp.]
MQHYQGSCHCNAITFAFDADPIEKGLRCNCSICVRKGALMSPFVLHSDQLKIDAKEGALGQYQFGSQVAKHYFCNHCGIYTFHETMRAPGSYRVNLGCIEGIDASTLSYDLFDGRKLI